MFSAGGQPAPRGERLGPSEGRKADPWGWNNVNGGGRCRGMKGKTDVGCYEVLVQSATEFTFQPKSSKPRKGIRKSDVIG